MYNLTNVTNSTTLFEQLQHLNEASGNSFGILLLFAIFLITFLALSKLEFKQALLVNSFITTIIAVLMFTMQMIEGNILIIPIVMLFGSVIINLFTQ